MQKMSLQYGDLLLFSVLYHIKLHFFCFLELQNKTVLTVSGHLLDQLLDKALNLLEDVHENV